MSKNGKPHPGIGQMIALAKIVPCPLNPRRTFDKDKLAALATSIAASWSMASAAIERPRSPSWSRCPRSSGS